MMILNIVFKVLNGNNIYLLSYSDYSEVIPFYGQNRWVILGATIYQIIYYNLG